MGLESHDKRFAPRGAKVVLYVDQGRRSRTRYRIVKAVNSIAFAMGRMLGQDDIRRIMAQGVQVIVLLRRGE